MAPPNHDFRYDVFLSFRGEDTCYTFTDHLYKGLLRAGLRTFRDDDTIQLGHQLKLEIKDAIKDSRASIVVLSENYASSRWCLDELSLIMEQRKKYNHIVLPVFYRVDRLAVREQGQSFSVEGLNWTVDNTIRWKEALTEVADLSGLVLSGYTTYETDFIEEVVETVNNQLDSKQMNTPAHLTGKETVNSQLDVKQPSTPAHSTGMETLNSQLNLKKLSIPAWRKTHQSRMRNVTEIPVTHEYIHSSQRNASGNDVYLSFKGDDTRHAFTDHLYHALMGAGLRTFRDNDVIERGQEIKLSIGTAINESRGSIVIFSQNYAKSRWCLEELCWILEQMRKSNHFVLPIFYHVDPSDVRNQRGSFSIEGSPWKVDDVRKWKAALRDVANLSGIIVSGYEVNVIKEVVDVIYDKLH